MASGTFDPYHRWLGIPPKAQPANYYRLLAIDLFESDREVIRDAGEQRMAHVRTYQLGQYTDLSQRILNELAAAKACLLDPEEKAAYDQQLRQTIEPAAKAVKQAAGPPIELSVAPRAPRTSEGDSPIFVERKLGQSPTYSFTGSKTRRWPMPAMIAAIAAVLAGVGISVGMIVVLRPSNGEMADRQGHEKTDGQESAGASSASTPADLPAPVAPSKPHDEPSPPKPKTPSGAGIVKPKPPAVEPPVKSAPDSDDKASNRDSNAMPAPPRKKPPKEPAKTPDAMGLPFSLALPSGKTVTDATFEVSEGWQKQLFPSIEKVKDVVYAVFYANKTGEIAAEYPSGPFQSIFTCHRNGSIEGNTAAFTDDGQLQVLASYRNGKLDGLLRLWDPNGQRLFYGQYKNGQKNGLACFFQNGRLQLIQECGKGKVSENYLVRWTQDGPAAAPTGELSSEENVELDKALAELEKLENKTRAK